MCFGELDSTVEGCRIYAANTVVTKARMGRTAVPNNMVWEVLGVR